MTGSVTPQRYIAQACEEDLARHGDSYRGAGYTKSEQEPQDRYAMMLNLIRERDEPLSLLDLGCGLAHLLDHLERDPVRASVRYTGVDISASYLQAARARRPDAQLLLMDVLADDAALPEFDYVVMNGVFNFRGTLSQDEMLEYWQRLLGVAWRHARRGLAFNVMSKIVDWERIDLFHLPLDTMAEFVGRHLSRHFVVRHDYPAWEYTVYVFRSPSDP